MRVRFFRVVGVSHVLAADVSASAKDASGECGIGNEPTEEWRDWLSGERLPPNVDAVATSGECITQSSPLSSSTVIVIPGESDGSIGVLHFSCVTAVPVCDMSLGFLLRLRYRPSTRRIPGESCGTASSEATDICEDVVGSRFDALLYR